MSHSIFSTTLFSLILLHVYIQSLSFNDYSNLYMYLSQSMNPSSDIPIWLIYKWWTRDLSIKISPTSLIVSIWGGIPINVSIWGGSHINGILSSQTFLIFNSKFRRVLKLSRIMSLWIFVGSREFDYSSLPYNSVFQTFLTFTFR